MYAQEPEYCQWAQTAAVEGSTCPKLQRLEAWLEQQDPADRRKMEMDNMNWAQAHFEGQGIQGAPNPKCSHQSSTGSVDSSGGDAGQRGSELEGGEGIQRLGDHDEPPPVRGLRDEGHMSQAWGLETREKPLEPSAWYLMHFTCQTLQNSSFRSSMWTRLIADSKNEAADWK